MQVCGVDDAGRGSMLGPLVIAGISIKKSKIRNLTSLGVRDSKMLSPKRRNMLYQRIIETVDDYHISRIHPRTIDAGVRKHALNHLEAEHMARVITRLSPDTSYVDSCDVNPGRFGKEISGLTNGSRIRSYHHADSRFVIVSAASIVAKVVRDRSIYRLQRTYNVGSGYPSDPKTIQFVTKFYRENHSLPSFVRKSWKPSIRITSESRDTQASKQ